MLLFGDVASLQQYGRTFVMKIEVIRRRKPGGSRWVYRLQVARSLFFPDKATFYGDGSQIAFNNAYTP